jgi:hypothetical protein
MTAAAGSWLVLDNTYEAYLYSGQKHLTPSGKHILHIFSFSKASFLSNLHDTSELLSRVRSLNSLRLRYGLAKCTQFHIPMNKYTPPLGIRTTQTSNKDTQCSFDLRAHVRRVSHLQHPGRGLFYFVKQNSVHEVDLNSSGSQSSKIKDLCQSGRSGRQLVCKVSQAMR